jgi:hypothetical protein
MVEIVEGDMARPETLSGPLRGVERAILILSSDSAMLEVQSNFIEEAHKAGVKHVVKLSGIMPELDSPFRFARMHAEIDGMVSLAAKYSTLVFPLYQLLALLCDPQLVHTLMNGRSRLQEGPFQIGLMVLLSVVVRHSPWLIPWAQFVDVGETTVDQREHVLRRLLVEEPPIVAAGHVDR